MNILQIFAKTPIVGKVKTRLKDAINEQAATDLHKQLIKHCLQKFSYMFTVQLWCYPNELHPFFTECKNEFDISLHQQQGKNLGERMGFALATTVPKPTILIGSDCPTLTVKTLQNAFIALQNNPVVLGPAEDGGYVLIGMQKNISELFIDIPWGTSLVLETTRSRLLTLQLNWYETATQWDVDRPQDLVRLEKLNGIWNDMS